MLKRKENTIHSKKSDNSAEKNEQNKYHSWDIDIYRIMWEVKTGFKLIQEEVKIVLDAEDLNSYHIVFVILRPSSFCAFCF